MSGTHHDITSKVKSRLLFHPYSNNKKVVHAMLIRPLLVLKEAYATLDNTVPIHFMAEMKGFLLLMGPRAGKGSTADQVGMQTALRLVPQTW